MNLFPFRDCVLNKRIIFDWKDKYYKKNNIFSSWIVFLLEINFWIKILFFTEYINIRKKRDSFTMNLFPFINFVLNTTLSNLSIFILNVNSSVQFCVVGNISFVAVQNFGYRISDKQLLWTKKTGHSFFFSE